MHDAVATKAALRKRFRSLRDSLDARSFGNACDAICQHALELPALRDARCVFCYISSGREVETHRLIRHLMAVGRTVLAPRMDRGTADWIMGLFPVRRWTDLEPGAFNVLQPPVDRSALPEPDVCIVPGLAFDCRGYRLGQGGGHYDRWLAAHPNVASVGLCLDACLSDALPTEAHDQPVDQVVTESQVLDAAAARGS